MGYAAKRIIALAAVAVLTASGMTIAIGEQPGDRPPGPRRGEPGEHREIGDRRDHPSSAPTSRPSDRPRMSAWGSEEEYVEPSEEEWGTIETFMEENSPKRHELFQRMQDRGQEDSAANRLRWAKRRMVERYRGLQILKERDNGMYEFAIKQLRIEDEVLATLSRIRQEDTPAQRDALQKQLREFVENAMQERALRIARWKELMKKEEASLQRDREKLEEMIERQNERFEREMRRMLDFEAESLAKPPTTAPAK